ncbi:MoxR-like ATPase [Rhodobium orientis]|uniref:Magnesium chelatase n=1 Tax=Rhodobium orientis TaxID=34017 RepID=A0A327JX35_9HYPH|nr:MoxR family ATPase [Rhodobium orientis]MBB4303990.1 MoxR-like ATPase [Rhodobium orientis]MBK5950800.1 magnesium chelatase [Rhodobium orientis]RAI29532.1 magnesium chelatase [Rhodobium orientis]
MTPDMLRDRAEALRAEIGKVVLGQEDVVELLLVALFAQGHVLLEGPPGTAKTLLARSFAAALDLDFGRIQFTPDLMPGDVLGTSIFNFQTNDFVLTKGPVFSQILLADEINRAPPKTQAALLQAMNERIVSIDGTDHALGSEFIVVATQNPIEQQGTYPLPEAQLDRFLFKLVIDFPPQDVEMAILQQHAAQPIDVGTEPAGLDQVLGAGELAAIRSAIDAIILDDDILAYILRLVRATRESADIAFGASTRAADALAGAARALAALSGRDYAIPDDVKRLFVPALRHRIVLGPTAEIEGRHPAQVLENILNQIEAPR